MPSVPDVSKKLRSQLHVSALNMMSDCAVRFQFRYLLGIKRPPSAFLLVGKSVDESVTVNLNNKIDKGELLPRPDVLGIAEAKFDAEQQAEPIELDADEKKEGKSLPQVLGEAKDKTVALAGLHSDEAAPVIRPKQTRRKFSVDLDKFLRERARSLREQMETTHDKYAAKLLDRTATSLNAAARDGMDFVGEQDIVERYGVVTTIEQAQIATEFQPDTELLVIRDTKTSAKSPTKSLMDGAEKPGIADDSSQLTAYATASYVIDGKIPDMMVLDYLVRTNAKTPGIYYVPTKTTRTADDIQTFLNRVVQAVHAIHEGVFTPANATAWQCSEKWCGFWGICPYASRPKSVLVKIGEAK